MADLSVNRTLVKSPPELWSEVSEVDSLARHLGEFGEIAITRLDPEHTVAWEGEDTRGTVELEASGWGTKVTLTAAVGAPDLEAADVAAAEPASEKLVESATPRPSWLRRLLFRERAAIMEEPEPATVEMPAVADDSAPEHAEAEAVLEHALDNLGAAHHRPFSRKG